MSEAAKDLVRRFYREAIVERDASTCERLLSEDFVHNGEARGRAGQRAAVEYFLAAFPDLSHEIELILDPPGPRRSGRRGLGRDGHRRDRRPAALRLIGRPDRGVRLVLRPNPLYSYYLYAT